VFDLSQYADHERHVILRNAAAKKVSVVAEALPGKPATAKVAVF
jgi:hypothetical protein